MYQYNLGDKKISIALMSPFVILTIQYFILAYFNLWESSDFSKVQLLSKMLVGLAFLYALPVVINRSKLKLIGSYFLAIFLFLLHFLMFPENSLYIKGLVFPFFLMCLPVFVFSMSIRDWNILKQYMKRASSIVLLLGAIIGLLTITGLITIGSYSMSLSYYMLLPLLIYLDETIERFSLRACLFSFVALLIILALGSRGAILCAVFFVLLKMTKYLSRLNYAKLSLYSIFSIVFIALLIYLSNILQYINNMLLNFGVNSRTLSLFLKGGVYLSGREAIYEKIIASLLNKPLLGVGLAGDRLILGGGYAHNLVLEIFINFGIIAGFVLLVILFFLIIKSYFSDNNWEYGLISIWLCLGFVPLMVSGSYLIDMNFWILIGLMIKSISYKKYKEELRRNPVDANISKENLPPYICPS